MERETAPTEVAGRLAYAAVMAWLGILAFTKGNFAPIWQPTPKDLPARDMLVYLDALILLAGGIGLLWRRTMHGAATALLIYLLAWLVLFRLSRLLVAPMSQETWSGIGETAVIVAGAAVLAITRERGLRFARVVFGLALIPFGAAHFNFPNETASLVPGWLPWHLAWAYLTGTTYIAAGIAIVIDKFAKLAAALVTLQMGMFTLLIWVPVVGKGANGFQWSEFVISTMLTAAGWAVAGSYTKRR